MCTRVQQPKAAKTLVQSKSAVGNNHLFPEEDSVCGGSQSPSKASAGPAGGDWPRSWGSCREAQLFSQLGEDLGQPEEGGPAEQTPGKSTFEERAFQN